MSYKKGLEPENFYEYTVYPLEGIWDISEEAKQSFDGTIDKNELVFNQKKGAINDAINRDHNFGGTYNTFWSFAVC